MDASTAADLLEKHPNLLVFAVAPVTVERIPNNRTVSFDRQVTLYAVACPVCAALVLDMPAHARSHPRRI